MIKTMADVTDIPDGKVVDAQIVDGEIDSEADQDKANLILQLEGLIKNHVSQLARLRTELSEAKAMLSDSFENDTTYREHADAAKEANKIKSRTKAEILKRPEVATVAEKVHDLLSQVKELDGALSDYLREFNQQSGITEIEVEDGELMQIVYVAKLVRKKA